MEDAILHFFFAYIDDAMHTEKGLEDYADRGAAFGVLRNTFEVSARYVL